MWFEFTLSAYFPRRKFAVWFWCIYLYVYVCEDQWSQKRDWERTWKSSALTGEENLNFHTWSNSSRWRMWTLVFHTSGENSRYRLISPKLRMIFHISMAFRMGNKMLWGEVFPHIKISRGVTLSVHQSKEQHSYLEWFPPYMKSCSEALAQVQKPHSWLSHHCKRSSWRNWIISTGVEDISSDKHTVWCAGFKIRKVSFSWSRIRWHL